MEKVICLISGGIDSAVASYMLFRRGLIPIFVCFDIYPYVSDQRGRTALDMVMKLKEHLPRQQLRVYIVPHGRDLEAVISNSPRRLTCLICRRMMFRKAEEIAKAEGASAIATGESLGQKASQTLINLGVTAEVLKEVPVLRPLIGMNKSEIERIAREIGIYEIATRASCTASPKRPSTKAKLEFVREAEKELDIKGIIEQDLREADIIDLTATS